MSGKFETTEVPPREMTASCRNNNPMTIGVEAAWMEYEWSGANIRARISTRMHDSICYVNSCHFKSL